jgi:uncharacterized membrane protein YraQ (UPF0718 family)
MDVLTALGNALGTSFDMFWDVLWPLVLGFGLSPVVQVFVSHRTMAHLLGKDRPRSLTLATLFGVASSSCSYAAVALARAIFRKGASVTNVMAFEIASTNLVIELGIILIVLMGWQFAASAFVGGILMVLLIAVIFRLTLTPRLVQIARDTAEKGAVGRMEGHAAMDMSVQGGSFLSRLVSGRGFTGVSHLFVADWASVWIDIAGGFIIAGALAAWVPESVWQSFFLTDNPTLSKIEGPLIGPVVAIFSFVCSIGNVPLAAVLWQGGISFGGVVSFIFADLIVLPILNIYRKYYGRRVMLYILATFYVTMAAAGYAVEIIFGALGLIPTTRSVTVVTSGPTWNYPTVLNIVFLAIAATLVLRFLRTGGPGMLRMMAMPEEQMAHHGHHQGAEPEMVQHR